MRRTAEHAERITPPRITPPRITPPRTTEPLPPSFSEADRLVDDALGRVLRREVSVPRSVTDQTVAASRALLPQSDGAKDADHALRDDHPPVAGRIFHHRMRISRLALAACVVLVAMLALSLAERSNRPPELASRDAGGDLDRDVTGSAGMGAEPAGPSVVVAEARPAASDDLLLPMESDDRDSDADYLLATNDISYDELADDLAMLVREMDL